MSTDAAAWIERAPISENDRRKICYDNAAELFGLPPPEAVSSRAFSRAGRARRRR